MEPIPDFAQELDMSESPLDSEAIAASLVNPAAFGVIFERHFRAIHDYLRRRLDRQLADELASQTFLVAFRRRADFDQRRPESRPWRSGSHASRRCLY
jgi:DNA-directed RNA polymerase specialized sigma24 family protein